MLPRTITSLLNQSYSNIEIVLVNDAGDDVQKLVDAFNDPRIKYFQNEKNKGLAGTRNVALDNSTGEYICLLDDDDIYLTYAIEYRMYMMQKLNAQIVYTRALLDIWERRGTEYSSVGKKLYWDMEFNRDRILVYNIAPCCCPLFSRKAWEESNYRFDESMTTTEDHDFWMALSRKYDFRNLELVDCECSQRTDKTQMTGSLNFVPNWIKSFQHWRHTADDLAWVTNEQNNVLKSVGVNPADYNL